MMLLKNVNVISASPNAQGASVPGAHQEGASSSGVSLPEVCSWSEVEGTKEEERSVYRHYAKHRPGSVCSLRAFAPLAIAGIRAG